MKHEIPTTRLEAYYTKISQINKKLARRKLPPIDLKVVGTVTKTELLDKGLWFEAPVKVKVTYRIIELTSPLDDIEVDGAAYLGTIKHDSDGSTAIFSRDEEAHSIRHLHEATHCDHCHTNRARKTLHVFEKDGKELVIGSTCCDEYFGFNVESTLSTYQWFTDLEDTVRTINGDCQSDPADFMEILAVSQYVINQDGTYRTENGTAGAVANILREQSEIQDAINSIDASKLAEIIEWWQTKDTNGDFEFNVKSVFENYSTKSLALIACGVWSYMKAQKKMDVAKNTNELNEHFGEEGKRYRKQTGTLTKSILLGPDHYSNANVFMYLIKTTDGHALKWVSSANTLCGIEYGETITFDFTVKRHEMYKDMKQTLITRIKVA